jgi:hypothetical protein
MCTFVFTIIPPTGALMGLLGELPLEDVVQLRAATLRHPYMEEGNMQTHERPPEVEGHDVLHNSTIAKLGISKGKGKGKQLHWEFVIERGDLQIYPEFIVTFDI